MAVERLYIENTYIPLSQGLNPSINKSITDISDPSTRKAAYSKTISIPRSKESDQIFSHYFEYNAINRLFDVNAKAAVRYEVDSEVIINVQHSNALIYYYAPLSMPPPLTEYFLVPFVDNCQHCIIICTS